MRIPIVVTSETTTWASAVVRPVRCPHCRCEYVYRDRIESQASTFGLYGVGHTDVSRELAADQKLQREVEFTPVPCPECFRYPEYMAERLRRDRESGKFTPGCLYLLATLFAAGLALAVATFTPFGFAVYLWVGAGIFAVLTTIYATAWVRSRAYQPNDDRHLAERQAEAKQSAITREAFEEMHQADARKSFQDRLAAGRERPGYGLTPIPVPLWLGYGTDRDWQTREPIPRTAMVTLPTGELYPLDLSDDVRELDEFDLKRTVDGVRVVFRVQVRFYHPTQLEASGAT